MADCTNNSRFKIKLRSLTQHKISDSDIQGNDEGDKLERTGASMDQIEKNCIHVRLEKGYKRHCYWLLFHTRISHQDAEAEVNP